MDSASAARAGLGIGDDPEPVDVVMLGQHARQARPLLPVTMLIAPAGTSEVSITW